MEKRAGMAGFLAVTAALLLFTAFLCEMTVKSQSGADAVQEGEYYRAKERELSCLVRDFLSREGMENSGVTVTGTADADGERTFTVTVHHGRIDEMSETQREALKAELEKIGIPDVSVPVSYRFLLDS